MSACTSSDWVDSIGGVVVEGVGRAPSRGPSGTLCWAATGIVSAAQKSPANWRLREKRSFRIFIRKTNLADTSSEKASFQTGEEV